MYQNDQSVLKGVFREIHFFDGGSDKNSFLKKPDKMQPL